MYEINVQVDPESMDKGAILEHFKQRHQSALFRELGMLRRSKLDEAEMRRELVEIVMERKKRRHRILRGLLVRLFFLVQIGYVSFYLVIWLGWANLGLLVVPMCVIIEGLYIAIKRNGTEFGWFSFTCFCYTFTMLTTIWMLTLVKYNLPEHDCPKDFNNGNYNSTTLENYFKLFVS